MKQKIGAELLEARTLLSALPLFGACEPAVSDVFAASAAFTAPEIPGNWSWCADALPELTVCALSAEETNCAERLETVSGAVLETKGVSVLETQDESSFCVTPLDGGSYSVEFPLPGSAAQFVFLTGLQAEDVTALKELVSQEETASFLDGFSGNFPDAEKELGDPDDSAMCWAAASANLLEFTGWGSFPMDSETGERLFSDEDAIFDVFCENFENAAGHIFYGLDWFLTGEYPVQGNALWSQLETLGSGGFCADSEALQNAVDRGEIFSYDLLRSVDDLEEMTDALRGGYGIGLSMGWYLTQSGCVRDDGHSVTCWGFVYDPTFETDSLEYYVGLLISDPDDSKVQNAEESLDLLHFAGLAWDENQAETVNGNPVYLTNYPASTVRVPFIETYVKLAPMAAFSDGETDGELGENAETVCRFDLNGDGKTAIRDLILFAHQYGKETAGNAQAQRVDFNGDAHVNILDLIAFAKHYGRECTGNGSCAVQLTETHAGTYAGTYAETEDETFSVTSACNEDPEFLEISFEILDRIFSKWEWGT